MDKNICFAIIVYGLLKYDNVPSDAEVQLHSEFPQINKIPEYIPFYAINVFEIVAAKTILKTV